MILNEHRLLSSEKLLQPAIRQDDLTARTASIARALASVDNEQLASAIDEAEAHQLIVHATRMRIVLAQRSGDHSQLERARAVLVRLGDRQYLRKLDEVAGLLP